MRGEIKEQSVKEMERELPLSEKPREGMRRERVTLSNAPAWLLSKSLNICIFLFITWDYWTNFLLLN